MMGISGNNTAARDGKMRVRTGFRAGAQLGDMVADGIQRTGLDRLATAYTEATGQDCGCKQRQQALNAFGSRLGIR